MKKSYIIIALIIIIGIILFGSFEIASDHKANQPVVTTSTMKQLQNSNYKVSFSYPGNYVLTEQKAPTTERNQMTITLVDKSQAAPVEGGESPTSITVSIYQNNIDHQSINQWLKNSSQSNFKLSPTGTFSSTTISGVEAVDYNWSGLYEGRTIATANDNYIYAFSVTRLTPEDKILKDFNSLLQTVVITK